MDITTTPEQDSTRSRHPWARRRRTWLATAGLALAVPAGAFAWSSAASADRAGAPEETVLQERADDCANGWTAEDKAAWSAESEALAAYLEAHGIEHEVVIDDGVTDVVTPADPAIDEAVNAFHAAYAEAHQPDEPEAADPAPVAGDELDEDDVEVVTAETTCVGPESTEP